MESTRESFGQRMLRFKQERGLPLSVGAGRKPYAEKFRKQVDATQRTFAEALPLLAKEYIDELRPKEPERCPTHNRVLSCGAAECDHTSQRTQFDHRAASYVIDRIMGRPTTRSENFVTVHLVQELTAAFILAFGEINALADPGARSEAFAEKLAQLGADYGSSAA